MKNHLQRLALLIFAAVTIITSATACRNTAHGAGEDIEDMGEKIQEKTD